MADHALTWSPTAADFADRRARLAEAAAHRGLDAVVVGPGADLRYLVGRTQGSHERMTALVVPAQGDAFVITPTLERPGWEGSLAAEALEFRTWSDGDSPYVLLLAAFSQGAIVAVDDYLPAMHVLGIAAITGKMPAAGGVVVAEQRMRKDAAEKAAMVAIGAANDRVQARIAEWLKPGRTEAEIGADVSAALLAEGHALVDFCIIGSGPNGASPHHEVSDRVVEAGDLVVVDIGGPAESGYFSDCTRTYSVGEPRDTRMREVFDVVRTAQEAGFQSARAGEPCEAVDAAARQVIIDAGYGQYILSRTGHGIGLECHEHPYIVRGNPLPLEPGMAFSVEPGIYLPGEFGVRIEDCVIIGDDGAPVRLNNCPKELVIAG